MCIIIKCKVAAFKNVACITAHLAVQKNCKNDNKNVQYHAQYCCSNCITVNDLLVMTLKVTNILLAAVWLLMCKNGVQKVGTEVEKAMFATQLEAN